MVLNAMFNNISAILWRSCLLVEETGIHMESHRPVASHCQILSHNVASRTPCHEQDFKTCIDCTGNCKSNYHTITTMTAPRF